VTASTAVARFDESESLLVAIARYTGNVGTLRRGNTLRPLQAGAETYPAMLAAMAAATTSICLETYIITADQTGDRFADVMCERAAAGVKVRFLFDAIGGFGLGAPFLARLRAVGVEVVAWNPISAWRTRLPWAHRDHKKSLIVDDSVAFTGGLNIADEYAAIADGGGGWHDVHCELRGPIVRDLARLFRATWMRAGGADYALASSAADAPSPGQVAVRVLENSKRRRRSAGAFRRAYIRAIRASRETVHLENAYFLPDRGVRRAMRHAVRRGVDVAIIVPGQSDVRMVEYAGMYLHRTLAAAGIRILRWTGPMMHAKTGVIDSVWATIGSYNLDARSFRHNLEMMVEVVDRDVGELMEAAWQRDQAHTEPFHVESWNRLDWWHQALAWLAFRFRSLL